MNVLTAEEAPTPPRRAEGHEGHGATILVVEDGELHRYILRVLFTEHGHRVLQCTNAFEALDLLLSGRCPDLMVTDFRLPGMDGLELIRRLRAIPATSEMPVVVRSASPGIEEGAWAAGADAFVGKGEAVSRLLATVNHLLRRKGAAPRGSLG